MSPTSYQTALPRDVYCVLLAEYTLGAGDGDRTRTASLEGWNSTIELLPQKKMVVGAGFEPAKAVLADLQSAPFGQLGYPTIYLSSY